MIQSKCRARNHLSLVTNFFKSYKRGVCSTHRTWIVCVFTCPVITTTFLFRSIICVGVKYRKHFDLAKNLTSWNKAASRSCMLVWPSQKIIDGDGTVREDYWPWNVNFQNFQDRISCRPLLNNGSSLILLHSLNPLLMACFVTYLNEQRLYIAMECFSYTISIKCIKRRMLFELLFLRWERINVRIS